MSEHQQSLFDTEPEPWQMDAGTTKLVATIILAVGPGGEYDYLVPEAFETAPADRRIEVGRRVRVPFGRGNRSVVGYCIRLEHKRAGSRRLKAIVAIIDDYSLLSPAMLRLTRWIADYYLCPWGQVLEAVVPGGVRKKAGTRKATLLSVPAEMLVRLAELNLGKKQRQAIECLAASPRPLTPGQLAELTGCTAGPIQALRKKGFITATDARIPTFQANEPLPPPRQSPLALNGDQQAALTAIHDALNGAEHRVLLIHGVTSSGKTEVYIQAIEETVRFGRQAIVLVPEISLTPQTLERFRARFDSVAVLHSHQTDAERHWQWRRIAEGEAPVIIGARSAVFAPTPHLGLIVIDEEHDNSFKQETAPRYHAREVARRRAESEKIPLVLGSATPSLESWHRAGGKAESGKRKAESGKQDGGETEIGKRKAESGEWKRESGKRKAESGERKRESGKRKAESGMSYPRLTDAPTTDSPTTDSPTTDSPTTDSPTTDSPTTDAPTTDAPTTTAYTLINMPRRIYDRPMPAVRIVDLREQRQDQPFRGAISRPLQQAINEALTEGGKVMLLLNRRGFSTHIQCPACGKPVICPDCEIPLTFHRQNETAICHYCDHEIPAPNDCPECGCRDIRYSGTGTQRLESEIRVRFPDAPCLRMDTDSMKRPGSHAKALAAFRDGAARILIGTQMIAKGHDFPDVTLVGVVLADTALHFPDFRASERTFQLITQVAGRTGRGDAGGRVVVQTRSPDHVAIGAAARHDYRAFAAQELPHRQALGYPPFASMVRIVVRGPDADEARLFAESLAERLRTDLASLEARGRILGPAPAPFEKLRGKYRFQILLRGPDGEPLREATQTAKQIVRPPKNVQWIADVDPQDML